MITRSKMTQATFTSAPSGSARPVAKRIIPTTAATASSTDTTICGRIRLQLGPPLRRAFGSDREPEGTAEPDVARRRRTCLDPGGEQRQAVLLATPGGDAAAGDRKQDLVDHHERDEADEEVPAPAGDRQDAQQQVNSVDSTVHRAHQHGTNLPRTTVGARELHESVC